MLCDVSLMKNTLLPHGLFDYCSPLWYLDAGSEKGHIFLLFAVNPHLTNTQSNILKKNTITEVKTVIANMMTNSLELIFRMLDDSMSLKKARFPLVYSIFIPTLSEACVCEPVCKQLFGG